MIDSLAEARRDARRGDRSGVHLFQAEGGQVYIYNTNTGVAMDNSQVTVVGTAYDVAYMDGLSDDNNTTY